MKIILTALSLFCILMSFVNMHINISSPYVGHWLYMFTGIVSGVTIGILLRKDK